MVLGSKWLPFSQVGGLPTSEREPDWWHINRVPNNVIRKQLSQIKWFILFLVRAFAPTMNDGIQSFQFTATNFMSMAAKLSDLVDKTPKANLQVDGQVEVPIQGAKDLWGSEEADSSHSHSPSWSPVWRPPQCEILFRDTRNFDRWIRGYTPTFSLLDGPISGRYFVRSKNWTYQSSADRPR